LARDIASLFFAANPISTEGSPVHTAAAERNESRNISRQDAKTPRKRRD
jgi:hypothetical protein